MSYLNWQQKVFADLRKKVFEAGEIVGKKVKDALFALETRDLNLAKLIIGGDNEVDNLTLALEMEALELISLQQPVEWELRFLAATIRISHELERIGDYACDIAETVLLFAKKGAFFKPLDDINCMGSLVQTMMDKSIRAYLENDLNSSRQMHNDDDEVDRLFLKLLDELGEYMKQGSNYVDQASGLILVDRYLERIGDHIVNIAEMTIFIESGDHSPFKTRKEGTAE